EAQAADGSGETIFALATRAIVGDVLDRGHQRQVVPAELDRIRVRTGASRMAQQLDHAERVEAVNAGGVDGARLLRRRTQRLGDRRGVVEGPAAGEAQAVAVDGDPWPAVAGDCHAWCIPGSV